MSIQARLARTLLLAIIGATVLLMSIVAVFGASEFREANEIRLTHIGHLALGLSASLPDGAQLTPIIDPEIYESLDLKDYVIVIRRAGNTVYLSPSLEGHDWSAPLDAANVQIGGERFDLVHVFDAESETQVSVGVLSWEANRSIFEIVLGTLVLFLAVASVLWWGTLRAIRMSLAPLHRFADDVADRHSRDLTPIDSTAVPAELTGMAESINGLLQKVDQALRQERQFVSNAAHELRSPMAGILAQIDSAQAGSWSKGAEDSLAKIRRAAERSSRLISQLLDHARMTSIADEVSMPPEFELVSFVEEVASEKVQFAVDLGVDLGLRCDVGQIMVSMPKDLLQIIIENLTDNAIKYGGTPGIVTVNLSRVDHKVELCIEDNGPGLSDQMFAQACRRFERFSMTKSDGYGLGLALVSELCDRLDIDVAPYRAALGGLGVRLTFETTARPDPE